MEKDPNPKMEYKLELMVLLVLLTTASSIALSREEFTEAVVRICRKWEIMEHKVAEKFILQNGKN